jgi:hypothetical protein
MPISRRDPPTTSLAVAFRLTTAKAANSGTAQIDAEIALAVRA